VAALRISRGQPGSAWDCTGVSGVAHELLVTSDWVEAVFTTEKVTLLPTTAVADAVGVTAASELEALRAPATAVGVSASPAARRAAKAVLTAR
jgi:hypothetical protein